MSSAAITPVVKMKTKVTEQGLLIPKQLLDGVEEVEIRKGQGVILIIPTTSVDPILELGMQPITCDMSDASDNHDRYLYG
jgi:hypothetical protein